MFKSHLRNCEYLLVKNFKLTWPLSIQNYTKYYKPRKFTIFSIIFESSFKLIFIKVDSLPFMSVVVPATHIKL